MPTPTTDLRPQVELSGTRRARLAPPLVVAGLVLAGSVALHLRDPHDQGSWGACPWLALTGTYCPGCGGLRAVNDLTHLRLADAVSSNLLFVALIPALAAGWSRSVAQRWRGALRPWTPHRVSLLATVFVGAAALFTLLRNVPAGSWLAP